MTTPNEKLKAAAVETWLWIAATRSPEMPEVGSISIFADFGGIAVLRIKVTKHRKTDVDKAAGITPEQ